VGLAALLTLAAACGRPLMRPDYPLGADEDEPLAGAGAADEDPAAPPLVVAPLPVSTGTISRQALNEVLDSGPGAFLRRVGIQAYVVGERFGGWEITSFTLAPGVDL